MSTSTTLTIIGQLRSRTGNPIVGATVVIQDGEVFQETRTTDAEGEFRVELTQDTFESVDWTSVSVAIAHGDRTLEIVERGAPELVGELTWKWPVMVDVTSGLNLDDGRWHIRGKLTDAWGRPASAWVSGAAIRLSGPLPVGEPAATSETGYYDIPYDWKPPCLPDLQVTASEGEKVVALSPIHFSAPRITRIDLVVDNRPYLGPTEYQRIAEQVSKCSEDLDIAKIGEAEIAYLIGKTRLPRRRLDQYLMAQGLASDSGLQPALFYGLFSAGLPASLEGLVIQTDAVIQKALASAIEKNIVGPEHADQGGELRGALNQMAVAGALKPRSEDQGPGIGNLLDAAGVPAESQPELLKLYLGYKGRDAAFWTALHADEGLGVHADAVKLTLQAGALASYHMPTMSALLSALGPGGQVRDLALWDDTRWEDFGGILESSPDGVPGETEEERLAWHLDDMKRTIRRTFAPDYTNDGILASTTFEGPLKDFLAARPDFDHGKANIPSALDAAGIAGEERVPLEQALQGIQRIYRLAPADKKLEVLEPLYDAGLDSAAKIQRLGPAQFVQSFARALGLETANQVFKSAQRVFAVSTGFIVGLGEAQTASEIFAIGGGLKIAAPAQTGGLELPTYEDLFGSQGTCACEHCRSVYSPAAYLVSLLDYLGQSLVWVDADGSDYKTDPVTGDYRTGLNVLFDRRPDIGRILLNCTNTNRVLPYIDLVNEILEREVAGVGLDSRNQTTWTEQELRANPEHRLDLAYDELAASKYPLSASFRLWNEETGHYLRHLGVERWDLAGTVLGGPVGDPIGFRTKCLVYLGLTELDQEILTGAHSRTRADVGELWGFSARGWRNDLSRVPVLLERSRLGYEELLELLDADYVQTAGAIGVDFSQADRACDLDGALLRYLDGSGGFLSKSIYTASFDRMQRFLRLRRKTGWSTFELGRVLSGLGIARIDDAALLRLSVLKQVIDAESLPVLEAAAWLGPTDTGLHPTDPDHRSLYEQHFQNPAVVNPPDEALRLDPNDRGRLEVEATGGALISDHISAIAAALQLTEPDSELLVGTLLDATGAVSDDLTLDNLGRLFRGVSLCRVLDTSISEHLLLLRLQRGDPWDARSPQKLLDYMEAARAIQASEFTFAEIGYLLLLHADHVSEIELDETEIGVLLDAIQDAVRGIWAQYERTDGPVLDELTERLREYFEAADIDRILTLIDTAPRTSDETHELEAYLEFLDPDAIGNAIVQLPGETANDRYEKVLVLLNRHGRYANSVSAIAQVVADQFELDQSAAAVILAQIAVAPGANPVPAIDTFLEPLFVTSGMEKLAAVLDGETLETAVALIEMRSALTEQETEDFIRQELGFLDTDEAVGLLVGLDAIDGLEERFTYVCGALDDGSYVFTESLFAPQFSALRRIQKIALLAGRFGIGAPVLTLLANHAADLGVLPPSGLPREELETNYAGFELWRALGALLGLRSLLGESEELLVAHLEKALRPELIDTTLEYPKIDELIAAGRWTEAQRPLLVWLFDWATDTGKSFDDLAEMAHPDWLDLDTAHLPSAALLTHLQDVTTMAETLGTRVGRVRAWSAQDLGPEHAAQAVQAARAGYELERWYEVAPVLRDPLRERQRDALSQYLLVQGGFKDETALYDHYLIDIGMSACMLTSRIKLALSSVQLFLQRCLLGLEDELVEVTRPDEWDWRKNYRVWEANRKVFLYPENWIEPELRLTRSEIFDAAHSILLQNAATREVAEMAVLRYLEDWDEVSRLEVLGSFQEEDPDRLHVAARTPGLPRRYFYRVREDRAWGPWEEIDADLDAEQVLPVVVNTRLYLFWPIFQQKQAQLTDLYDSATIESLLDVWASNPSEDAYHDYLLHYNRGSEEAPEILADEYNSLEEWVEVWSQERPYDPYTVEDAIDSLVQDGALPFDEFVVSDLSDAESTLTSSTMGYFTIGLSYCEYKNGKWSAAKQSVRSIDSDTFETGLSILYKDLTPAEPGDFHFFVSVSEDMLTIECLQSLRYKDGTRFPGGTTDQLAVGRFEYDVLGKEALTRDSVRSAGISELSNTSVVGNAFLEQDGDDRFEILELEAHAPSSLVTLLATTPGDFRVPIQHQHEQFTAAEDFFFGDDKRGYLVSSVQDQADSDLLRGDYLFDETPGIGMYPNLFRENPREVQGQAISDASPWSAPATGNVGVSRTGTNLIQNPGEAILYKEQSVDRFFALVEGDYRFSPVYHPQVGELIRTLNGEGIELVFAREMQQSTTEYFDAFYTPTDRVIAPYPRRSFEFSETDANGSYNWEFFFHLPLLVATRLSRDQKFAEAQKWLHLIFDPTSREGGSGAERFWQFKPFFDLYGSQSGHPSDSIYDMLLALSADPATADPNTLALKESTEQQIETWLEHPFEPHEIARLRPVAYMKATVRRYLENLIAWGDNLFARFTLESIDEATQLYILAYQILGPRPVEVPGLEVVEQSYSQLGELDAFSNAVAMLENLISLPQGSGAEGSGLQPLYFCIPSNPMLLELWDRIEDRLFKIRHCMDIQGVVRQLPLFEPPIDPGLLVRATAAGVDIGSALASLSTPPPHYRFGYLLQKALEHCSVVKGLAGQLLAALEKGDSEALALLQAEHQESLLKASTELRNLQVDEARENLAALKKAKTLVHERIEYYSNLERSSQKEREAIAKQNSAEERRGKSAEAEKITATASAQPNISVGVGGIGMEPSWSLGSAFGGSNIGSAESARAGKFRSQSAVFAHQASKLTTEAAYERRWDEWKHQERIADKELKQIEDQILAAEVRLALAEKERDNHLVQLDQAREVRETMVSKFTSKDLYDWLSAQVSSLYFQSYQTAYDLARRSEKAAQRELGDYEASYVAYGHWDSLKKGLLAGERLEHELRLLESHYIKTNTRELELTKHFSLRQIDPRALLELRYSGTCFFSLPQVFFDLDYPNHYFRRIKAVSLTIPAVTGPYSTVTATLSLQGDRIRTEPDFSTDLVQDEAFLRIDLGAKDAIATSSGQSDPGLFQLDFRDERYLPFEAAGAVSDWKLSLGDPALAQLDRSTISDVILHLQYRARDGGEAFGSAVSGEVMAQLNHMIEENGGVPQLISLKNQFPATWARMMGAPDDAEHLFDFELTEEMFPYLLRNRFQSVHGVQLYVVPADGASGPFGNARLLTGGSEVSDLVAFVPPAGGALPPYAPPVAVFDTALNGSPLKLELGEHQLKLDTDFLAAREEVWDLLFLSSVVID